MTPWHWLRLLFVGTPPVHRTMDNSELWCQEFVPFSVYGEIDYGMDACDQCSCPRASHPVMTYEDEVRILADCMRAE